MKTLKQNPQTIDKNGEDIPEKATIRQYKKKGTLLAACEAYTCQSVYEDHALHYEISFSNNDVTCKILRTVYWLGNDTNFNISLHIPNIT